MIRAPWSTAYATAAASSASVSEPAPAPAFTIISLASPPKPAMPSPFVTEPAASVATNVPWPMVSATVCPVTLYASGLRGEVRRRQVGAGVDDGDRDRAGGAEDGVG